MRPAFDMMSAQPRRFATPIAKIPRTPLDLARDQDRQEFITEASAVMLAAMLAQQPDADERRVDRLVANAVQAAERLYSVLVRRGWRP